MVFPLVVWVSPVVVAPAPWVYRQPLDAAIPQAAGAVVAETALAAARKPQRLGDAEGQESRQRRWLSALVRV